MPQEEIAKAPALEPMTEKQLNDLLGEEMYLGETDWRGNKLAGGAALGAGSDSGMGCGVCCGVGT